MNEAINILYVEDNEGDVELMRMSIERYFTSLSIILDVAETVEEAKEIFDQNKHAMAMIDWNLPDGEGAEVLQFIRTINENMPVFMLSGVITERNFAETEKFKPTACLEKGHDQKIIAQLEQYLSAIS